MIRHFVFPDCFAQCMSVDIPEASAYIADMLKQKNTEQVRTTAMPILSAAVAEPSKPKKPMKMYVGITDYDCYTRLKANKCDEVSFWTPGTTNFRALEENDMFLFKLHSPRDYIVGGGFFVRFSMLPTYLAWSSFGIKTGTTSLKDTEIYLSSQVSITPSPKVLCLTRNPTRFFLFPCMSIWLEITSISISRFTSLTLLIFVLIYRIQIL